MSAPYASAIVVSITPKEPSCFAGEELQCTITFTNTNAPPRSDPRRRSVRSASGAQRRGLVAVGTDAPSPIQASASPVALRKPKTFPYSHPHARQKSVVAYQVEDLSRAFGLLQSEEEEEPMFQPSPHPDMFVSHNEAMDAAMRDSVMTWAGDSVSPLFPSRDTLPVGYEKLLWTFAQFGGTMELEHSLIRPTDFDRLRMRLARGELPRSVPSSPASSNGTPRTLGGGEFGYDAEYEADGLEFDKGLSLANLRERHAPAMATIAALLFGRSTTPRSRHVRTGSTLSDIQTRALMSRTLPTYSTPPSMLGIDMVLAPGEQRSFTFSLKLPADLPPSFHGHSVHFDYYLTVGTSRLDARTGTQPSRLLHVPIRVYNHVAPGVGALARFELLNPIVTPHADDGAVVAEASRAPHGDAEAERERTAQWIEQLLRDHQPSMERTDPLPAPTCMDAVLDLTLRAGKVSYDIAKNGHVAAVLTLARAKYRLGDSVQALVRMNAPDAMVRIVRIAASLESHEEIDASMALLPTGRIQKATTQVYATHHENTLDTRQTSFALVIPSGATPEFVTSGIRHGWSLRLSLLTQTSHQGAVAVQPPPHIEARSEGYAAYHHSYHGAPALCGHKGPISTRLEIVECSVPVTVLPNRSKRRTGPVELYA